LSQDSSVIVITERPFKVDELLIPERYSALIESTRAKLQRLATRLSPTAYQNVTVFIDPIDGTKEFYSKLGEQCTIW
jgi:3'-phosphoadenosine 5'-phosphosulfate (PAPS) 3'-phosphatase